MTVSKSRVNLPPLDNSKTLVLSSRGIISRHRHLMLDIISLLANSKKESKFDSKKELADILEICELNDCNRVLFFESRKKEDLYLWIAGVESECSLKFYVSNIHTMDELSFTGNSIRGICPILSFDPSFDSTASLKAVKEAFVNVSQLAFGLSSSHTKAVSKTETDRIYKFTYLDGKIWFRAYQIFKNPRSEIDLVEIGPRFVLTLLKILESGFHGPLVYNNDSFIPPTTIRSLLHKRSMISSHPDRYLQSVRKNIPLVPKDSLDSVFNENSGASDSE